MSRASRSPLLSLVVACSTLFALGCNEPGSRCEGRDIYYCNSEDILDVFDGPCKYVKAETCPHFCVESNGQAFCSLSENFAPNCPPWRGEDENGFIGYIESHCEDDTVVLCRDGYLIEKNQCDLFCVEPVGALWSDAAICANEPEPNPACNEVISACIDGMVTACDHGFAIDTPGVCAEGTTCTMGTRSEYNWASAYCKPL